MANTPNYQLYKPSRLDTDKELDTTLAANFTTIDAELKANKDSLDTHKNNVNAHASENITHADGSVKATLTNHEERIGDLESVGTGVPSAIRNVKIHGALGDGVTDDSAAINAAINYVKNNGGGEVYLPPGTFIVAGIDIFSKIHLRGSGKESTILKLKDNANQDVIYSDSVYTLMGTNSLGGENNFSISDLTIDGNRENNPTAGHGINIYGYDYTINAVSIRNCSMKGFISEWGQWGTPSPNGSMEAHIQDLKVSNCGTEGIDFAGPHDSQFVNVIVNNNNKNGWGASGALVRGNGSAVFTNTHVWGSHEVAYKLDGIAHLVNCQGEGAHSNVVILANDCTVIGGHYYGFNPGEVAFVIGSSTKTVSGTLINTKVTNCQGGVINFVNDYSGSYTLKAFSSTAYATTKGILGTLNANSYLFLMNEAPNGANIHKLPSGYTTTV